jgi:hypothetical protein
MTTLRPPNASMSVYPLRCTYQYSVQKTSLLALTLEANVLVVDACLTEVHAASYGSN